MKRPSQSSPGRHAAPREGRSRLLPLVVVGAVAAVSLVGSAGAAPTTDTTAVAFVDIPPKQVWGTNSVSPGKAESVVVIGGTTTVPTNATTVRLQVTVKGGADGTLRFFPAGNEAGGAGHTLSWTAGGTNTGVTQENVGLQNKVSVFNESTKAAVVTIKVTGYSTQVTAGDVNGSGGTAGQVLTNNGAGGATWEVPGRSFAKYDTNQVNLTFGGQTVSTVTVPAGSYVVSFDGTLVGQSVNPDFARCFILAPNTATAVQGSAGINTNIVRSSMSLQGQVTTGGGDIRVHCWSEFGNPMAILTRTLTAQKVGSVSGSVTVGLAPHAGGVPTR